MRQQSPANRMQDLRQKLEDERNQRIWEQWLACWTEEQIAEAVGLGRSQISKF